MTCSSLSSCNVQFVLSNLCSIADFLGCYNDDKWLDDNYRLIKSRALPHEVKSFSSKQDCVDQCASNGFLYAGLQNGDLCFCGNFFDVYGRARDSECNLKCRKPNEAVTYTDNMFQSCGGRWRNSVYSGMHIFVGSFRLDGMNILVGSFHLDGMRILVGSFRLDGMHILVGSFHLDGMHILVGSFHLDVMHILVGSFHLDGVHVLFGSFQLDGVHILVSSFHLGGMHILVGSFHLDGIHILFGSFHLDCIHILVDSFHLDGIHILVVSSRLTSYLSLVSTV